MSVDSARLLSPSGALLRGQRRGRDAEACQSPLRAADRDGWRAAAVFLRTHLVHIAAEARTSVVADPWLSPEATSGPTARRRACWIPAQSQGNHGAGRPSRCCRRAGVPVVAPEAMEDARLRLLVEAGPVFLKGGGGPPVRGAGAAEAACGGAKNNASSLGVPGDASLTKLALNALGPAKGWEAGSETSGIGR